MKLRIKKGDHVEVIAGSNKGKSGTVSLVIVDKNRAVVDGVNIAKKHTKPANNNPGGIIEMAVPIHISNLSLLDPVSKKPTRVGVRVENGKKVRYSKKSNEIIK